MRITLLLLITLLTGCIPNFAHMDPYIHRPMFIHIPSEKPSLTDVVADIIYTEMIPINGPRIDKDTAWRAANEILYLIDVYEMVDEDLPYVLSLFFCESKFDSLAVNPTSGARGFGQLMLYWHQEKLDECGGDWTDVECNIFVSFRVMAYGEYAHCTPDRRWRNIYEHNYNTGAGTGWIGVYYHDKFKALLEEM